jgi:hypothetical protein
MNQKLIVEIPAEMTSLHNALTDLVGEVTQTARTAKLGRIPDYGALERSIAERVSEIERQSHKELLSTLDVDSPFIEVKGTVYCKVGRYEAPYHCQAGDVKVERNIYREVGTRSGKTVDPVSLQAGVVGDGWLPGTARVMSFMLQQGTSREAAATSSELGRLPYSKSSFEEVGHQVGELYTKQHPEIENKMIQSFEIPKEATGVSISIDRVSVPLEEPRKRPVGRPRKDAPKNPIERVFRMAYCGTVTLHDKNGEALHTIRYGRMPEGDPVLLCQSMAADALVFLSQNPELNITLLADGAKENWNLFDLVINEETLGQKPSALLDMWHVIEKLGHAALVIFGKKEASYALNRWKMMLLNSSAAARLILGELRQSGCENVQVGQGRPVHEAITYFENNLDRLDYAKARKQGRPLGSGNVEATCKSLFEMRLKRSGARWKEATGEHIVHLRALALSDRWGQAIDFLLKPLATSVTAKKKVA